MPENGRLMALVCSENSEEIVVRLDFGVPLVQRGLNGIVE